MLAFWLDLPLTVRLILLAVIGLAGGALANHVIYTYCWFARPISPWVKPNAASGPIAESGPATLAAPRRRMDRVPILGWFSLRRETELHGRGFWIRPLLIEIGLATALPALYLYECQLGGLLSAADRNPATLAAFAPWANTMFFAHAILLLFMTAATFIDFDEQTIPDVITIPGTILGLLLSAVTVRMFLPAPVLGGLLPVTFNMPWVVLAPHWHAATGLLTALLIWTGWCFALADRRVILRRGYSKAVEFFLAGLVRYPTWKLLVSIWVVGLLGVSSVWAIGGVPWLGLMSSLVGLAVGGGVVWAVRIVASSAMGVEAMGFGDVTLMAMIGAFLGWQASLAAFFLAPIAAIAIVLIQFMITRQPRVPFGPYLCAGSLLTILFWNPIYVGWLQPNLMIGQLLLWFSLVMLILMGVFLFIWRRIKAAIFYAS